MQELTVPQILQIAQVCEYVDIVKASKNVALNGGDMDARVGRLIYMERLAVQNRYNLNPSDPTLIKTGNYLFSLLKSAPQAQNILNGIAGGLSVLTGPVSQSVNVGDTATFSVSVAGVGPFFYQWFLNGIAIIGATSSSYNNVNSQLSDTGKQFSVQVTNSAGPIISGSATLTVTTVIQAFFAFSTTTDFYPILLTNSDPFTYGSPITVTHNAPIAVPLPGAMPANVFTLIKVPIGESVKTIWGNTALNFGTIPDSVFESIVQFGGFTYYASRGQISFDVTQPLAIS